MVKAAKERELADWQKFGVFEQVKKGAPPKTVVDTRSVLTWETLGGRTNVGARLVANGFRDPDLNEGVVETAGSASLRSSTSQVIILSAP